MERGFHHAPILQYGLLPSFPQVIFNKGIQAETKAFTQRIAGSEARRDRVSGVDGDTFGTPPCWTPRCRHAPRGWNVRRQSLLRGRIR